MTCGVKEKVLNLEKIERGFMIMEWTFYLQVPVCYRGIPVVHVMNSTAEGIEDLQYLVWF